MEFYLKTLVSNYHQPTDDEIYCDEWKSKQTCFLFFFVVEGVIGAFICTMGISGNILSLFIIHKINNRKSATMFLLKSLAIADSCILLLFLGEVALPSTVNYFGNYEITNSHYLYFRWYVSFPIMRTSYTVSAWITCILTLNR